MCLNTAEQCLTQGQYLNCLINYIKGQQNHSKPGSLQILFLSIVQKAGKDCTLCGYLETYGQVFVKLIVKHHSENFV